MSIEKNTPQSLEKPEIEEAPSGKLNWYDLNGKNFNTIIRDLPSDAVDKELKLTWLGTTADGDELDPEYKKHPVQWPDIFNGLKIELENDLAKAVVGGSAVIDYEIAPDLKSPSLNITVIDGTPVTPEPELKSPEVIEAIDSALSPDRVGEDGATVLIKTVAPIVEGDQILLAIIATNGDGTPIELEPPAEAAGAQHTVFSIAKGLVEAIAGGSLTLRYTVNGETSPTLELSVDYGIIPPKLEGKLPPQPGAPIKIIVPKYTGMNGDKIAISIDLPHLSYRSSQEEASELEDQTVEIPFGIFISSLSTTAIVHYHVSRQIDENNEKAWTSIPLSVQIIGHDITMAPPVYLSFADIAPKYNLSYHGIAVGSIVQVYWHAEGRELRQAELTIDHDGDFHYVPIPRDWLTSDKSRTVCGNFSILQDDGTSRKFSPGVVFQA
ncbi:hypothetical protein DFS21_101187 [Pseudomonas sp. 2848]|uniref:hypothetical protein n=1 Tax=Pseudomonas sp. 2848 TaxID=2183926 RepID=UPI000DB76875|nr:hypothetical protein [Pseudomonas sp. 2848]PZW86432.1 hypothetical protein DFS21_101187 [Pseudomonas sp. 2848]